MVVLIRYDEIGIKGRNRIYFERILIANIRYFAKEEGIEIRIEHLYGRILMHTNTSNETKVKFGKVDFLKRIFGIVSYSVAEECGADMESLKEAVKKIQINGSFRIRAQRSDKSFPFKSQEIEKLIGKAVQDRTNAKVDLKNFETEIGIEIVKGKAYIFSSRIACIGGLPVGTSSIALACVCCRNDELAALLMLKRGCHVIIVPKKYTATLIHKFAPYPIIPISSESMFKKKLQKHGVLVESCAQERIECTDTNISIFNPLDGFSDVDKENVWQLFYHAQKIVLE